MGRRSLAVERRGQILAAAIECMATHGVSGSTLERIAETAGMARGHVRHFAGNREDLLVDAARVFYFTEAAMDDPDVERVASSSPILDPSLSVEGAIEFLFGEFAAPTSENAAAWAFMDAGRTIPAINDIVVRAYRGMHESLVAIIDRAFPGTDTVTCRQVANGVFSTALGVTLLTDIDASAQRIADARALAEAAIGQLGADSRS